MMQHPGHWNTVTTTQSLGCAAALPVQLYDVCMILAQQSRSGLRQCVPQASATWPFDTCMLRCGTYAV